MTSGINYITSVTGRLEVWVGNLLRLLLSTNGDIDIKAHDAATVGLKLGGTLVSVSAAEINFLESVSYGIDDSGGVGFKVLRVPN